MRKQTKQFFEFGPFRLDVEKGRLTRSGEIILLPPKAISLLLALLRGQGKVVEKEVLLETLWPDTVVEDSNLTQTVHLLRKALGKNGDSEPRIETLPKIGYRLVAEVREVWEQEDSPAAKPPAPVHGIGVTGAAPAPLNSPELMSEEAAPLVTPDHGDVKKEALQPGTSLQVAVEGRSVEPEADIKIRPVSRPPALAWFQSRNVRISVLAMAGIIAGIVFGFIFSSSLVYRGTGAEKVESVAVAVLPFYSSDAKSAAPPLGFKMVETLIAKLKGARRVNVLPSTAISGYRERKAPAIEVGRDLGVDVVVTGQLENKDGRLFLRVQARRVADDRILLDEKFEEPFGQPSELAKLENRIVEKITASLEKLRSAGR